MAEGNVINTDATNDVDNTDNISKEESTDNEIEGVTKAQTNIDKSKLPPYWDNINTYINTRVNELQRKKINARMCSDGWNVGVVVCYSDAVGEECGSAVCHIGDPNMTERDLISMTDIAIEKLKKDSGASKIGTAKR